MHKTGFIFLLITGLIFTSCSGTDKTRNRNPETGQDTSSPSRGSNSSSSNNLMLTDLRTQLSDLYTTKGNEIPEYFTQVREITDEQEDPYQGFRIQIYSGESVDRADTLANRFRIWADSTITGYEPETYVFFKAPYYRVHVGDFHNRSRADDFTKIVKRYFRDAWVVYDQVNPRQVPSDTTTFRTK